MLVPSLLVVFLNDSATIEIYTLSLDGSLPMLGREPRTTRVSRIPSYARLPVESVI